MIDSIYTRIPVELLTGTQLNDLPSKLKIDKVLQGQWLEGTYKNFRVKNQPGFITVHGSIPKLLNEHNVLPISNNEVVEGLRLLESALGIPILKGHIARLDVGETIPVASHPIHHFDSLKETPNYIRIPSKKRVFGVQYRRGDIELSFYNKTDDVLSAPIPIIGDGQAIRIELRIKSRVKRNLRTPTLRPLPVAYLLSEGFLREAAKLWLKHYQAIQKKHTMVNPPVARSTKDFLDFLLARHLQNGNSYNEAMSFLEQMQAENGWTSRKVYDTKVKIQELLNDPLITLPNNYTAEMEAAVKQTTIYKIAKGLMPVR